MKTHELNLAADPFRTIVGGQKTIETRLFDEKRQGISVGDMLIFRNRDDGQTVTVHVVGMHHYDTFKELFSSHNPIAFGGESVEQLLDQIYTFYTAEDEKKFGVVGIEIKKQTPQ